MVQAEYLYNAMGQQVARRLTQARQTIHSVHDLAGNRLAEYDYDPQTGTATLLQEYIWLDGAPVAVVDGAKGAIAFIRTDHIARPVFATDDVGIKVWEASYLPFGGVQISTGSNPDLRFPGQWFQSESGLHQNWIRDYDPTTGRYIQADPLGLVDGAPVYGYVRQSPLNWVDPDGMERKEYKKRENPNRKKGAEERQKGGERERNKKHPNAEEHIRRPKGGFRLRMPGIPFIFLILVGYVHHQTSQVRSYLEPKTREL